VRTEDGHIINKCLNGDRAAYGLLVDKYKASIYGLAYSRLGNFHDAEDVTQEVFIKAYENLRSLKQYDSFLAWLYAITSNLCKNWIRARSRRPDHEFIEDKGPEALESSSMRSYREKLAQESIQEALDSLPQIHRQVLTLHYLGGMSGREIARLLGTSPNTIRQRLFRARAQLKEEMLDVMSRTFERQRLQASFTLRIIEAVKRVKIHPTPRTTGLPWGLSLAAGVFIVVLGLNPQLNSVNPVDTSMDSPGELKVMEMGEIPVDVLNVSQTPMLSSSQGEGDSGDPGVKELQNAISLAPRAGEGEWIPKADMPTARYFTSACPVNGKIYIIGGTELWPNPLSTVEEYNPVTDTWAKKSDMPSRRGIHSASAVNGKIYVIGGAISPASAVSTVEEYDPEMDTWLKKTDMPTPRAAFSTSAVNGKIYAIGGWRPGMQVSTVEEYDPETDTWTKKSDMPTAREGLSTSVANGKIYAIGGVVGFGADEVFPVVEEYDPETDTWTKKSDMPTPRAYLSTCAVKGRIYAIGGTVNINSGVATVEEYDPAADKWTPGADMLTPRLDFSASAVDDRIYVFGGVKTFNLQAPVVPVLSSVEMYTLAEGQGVDANGKKIIPWGEIKLETSMLGNSHQSFLKELRD
jgi:RNA polymerase sigma factor (sigma-70 family)